jgi:HD-GYP domain-containing protein (c-di-GMP phosphodiesterase class II)
MRFATRTFLWSFIPFAILLTGTSWTIQTLAVSSVRNELRSSLRQTQISMARVRSKSELQNSRFLRVVGDNAPLKAGLQLMASDGASGDARRTVEDQLHEICESLSFDFLMVSNTDGIPLAGVMRVGNQLFTMDIARTHPPQHGFFTEGRQTYQVTSVPVDQGEENIGILSVGEHFDFSEFNTPAVLTRNGKVLKSSVPGVASEELETALRRCAVERECELNMHGQTYLSLPMDSIYFGDGYLLRSLQNVDSASGPVQAILRNVFLIAGLGALIAALIMSAVSSRSIVKPIAAVVSHLRESAKTGALPEFRADFAPIQEIRELMESFNHAAVVNREAEANLRRAYVEFVGSLASALDARDRYTAGHSRRVSERACTIATAMNLPPQELEDIQIGALLHDIGKIGVSDNVLQKPGKLTDEEFALVQQHPGIGRRILEGVNGFKPYLPIVELHHENWDGTGYPWAFAGEAVPLGARIVHVVDAYDAMTSDRPYRSGMSHDEAVRILHKFAGTQFDPDVVQVFTDLLASGGAQHASLQNLAQAVEHDGSVQSELRNFV